nr:hypothetical protein [Tanacetum cinerariifolium]
MASAIICLATNQKLNFSKYIFDNMVKHLDGRVKFLMYPRFVQVFLDNQVEGIDRRNVIFVISSHTKKVFANMKRERKDFSRKVAPLFATMMVQAPEDIVTTAAKTLQISKDELTLAQTLIEIKVAKPRAITTAATIVTAVGTRRKEKGIVMQEPSETPSPKPIISSQKSSQAKDKDKRKKYFERLRAKKIRSKPPTKTQKRNQMCTYLKNMANYKHNKLKNQSFEEIQMLFNNTMKWIEEFVPMDKKLVKDSEKSVERSEKAVERSKKVVEGSERIEEGNSKRASKNMVYYLLVEKMYPFTRNILHQMWNNVRLQVDYEVEMAYDLLRLIRRQINE